MTGEEMLQRIVNFFYTIFLGLNFADDKKGEIEKEKDKARIRLTKMQICDIFSLKEFTCEYEKNLYKLPQGEFPDLVKKFLEKLPIIGEKSVEEFNKRSTENTKYSLGFASRIKEEQISLICDLTKKQKQLKRFNKNYCTELIDEHYTKNSF